MKCQAVIGLNYGDESKGKVVSYLCTQAKNPLVVRFSGGQQAGHHVMLRGKKDHVFASFGSGTLQGHPTYFTGDCCISPTAILNELDVLKQKGVTPKLYLDSECPVTTPYEVAKSKDEDKKKEHGTCGMGINATFQREADHFSLRAGDLRYNSVWQTKLRMLKNYYPDGDHHKAGGFMMDCEELLSRSEVQIIDERPWNWNFDTIIFEGSQGLLLDQHYGFFPHVTRANTGLTNIRAMAIEPNEVFFVTRGYQTRHGNGPMAGEGLKFSVKENPYEQNGDDGIQGVFRKGMLDLDSMMYAIKRCKPREGYKVVMTCMDLMEEFAVLEGGRRWVFETEEKFLDAVFRALNPEKLYVSFNPFPEISLARRRL